MRTILYDSCGEPGYYLTGAGVLYRIDDRPLGFVVARQLLGLQGQHLGWFDGVFLRDREGFLVAFAKGSRAPAGLDLPTTRPLRSKPRPIPVPFRPLLAPRTEPDPVWRWSPHGDPFATELRT